MDYIFNIKSYIKRPNVIIEDIITLNDNYESFFLDLENDKVIKEVVKDINKDYIEGVIYLEYNDIILMDFTYWDILDQLWTYMIQLVDNNLENEVSKIYFPDQPIELQLKSITKELVLFSIEATAKTQTILPRYEFYMIILESAKIFFNNITKYFTSYVDYSYELDLIKKIEDKLFDSKREGKIQKKYFN